MNMLELTRQHLAASRRTGFKGFDVYDGLRSEIFRATPLFRSRPCRLAWIQLFKRSPVNLRRLARVRRGYNAKGLALFMRGLLRLRELTGDEDCLRDAYELAAIIVSQRAADREYFCVGYNFFWEAKAFSVPEFTPNMIVSAFVGQAFLDLYEIDRDDAWLEYSRQIGTFIEKELLLFESEEEAAFRYVPGDSTIVHNVTLIGSGYLARLYHHTGDERFAALSRKSAQCAVNHQRADGSWFYGAKDHHRWVDSFHTGFNLVALHEVQRYLQAGNLQGAIDEGLAYHLEHHFLKDMTPKYFDTGLYPIDIHNFAQGVITLIAFDYPDKARELLGRCIDLMWDRDRHYFYYQKTIWYTNRIDYIRWSQAWMFFALTVYLLAENNERDRS